MKQMVAVMKPALLEEFWLVWNASEFKERIKVSVRKVRNEPYRKQVTVSAKGKLFSDVKRFLKGPVLTNAGMWGCFNEKKIK